MAKLYGALCKTLIQIQVLAIEVLFKSDAVAQTFCCVASLDFLSRILGLHNLLNNPDNFRLLITEATVPFLKGIDFCITDGTIITVNYDHVGGNGFCNYAGSHQAMHYGLCDRPRAERVKAAILVLTEGALAQLH